MAVPNIRIVNTQLDSANCNVPLMPWPLAQPPARRAPYISSAPPIKAAAKRTATDGPNRCRHAAGTVSMWNCRAATDAASAQRITPTRKIDP